MTKIEWVRTSDGTAGKTWNPVVGCSIVSPSCTNCYAMKMAARLEAMAVANGARILDGETRSEPLSHYLGTTQRSKAGPVWTGQVALAPERILTEPLRRKKPTTYFVNSMGDLFHEDVPDEWIDLVFAVMALCQQHTFQVLTKRSARMRSYVTTDIGAAYAYEYEKHYTGPVPFTESASVGRYLPPSAFPDWPLANVWLGVSAERQQEADARIPDLLATPAAVRFVSAEPLLGPIDFTTEYLRDKCGGRYPFPMLSPRERTTRIDLLDWIIVGGESGPGARPMHPEWARSIRDQCAAAGVAFFFKQWGAWMPSNDDVNSVEGEEWATRHFPGRPYQLHSSGHTFVNVGKVRTGRRLDGREHNDMPGSIAPVMELATK